MLTVDTIWRIRREHFLKGKGIKEIARDLRVSRNTVRKVRPFFTTLLSPFKIAKIIHRRTSLMARRQNVPVAGLLDTAPTSSRRRFRDGA